MNESMTPAELAAACKGIKALFPNKKADVAVNIDARDSMAICVYPDGLTGKPCTLFRSNSFASAFRAAREWAGSYQDNRRAEAERKLAEAQAELAELGGITASLPVEVHCGVESAQ